MEPDEKTLRTYERIVMALSNRIWGWRGKPGLSLSNPLLELAGYDEKYALAIATEIVSYLPAQPVEVDDPTLRAERPVNLLIWFHELVGHEAMCDFLYVASDNMENRAVAIQHSASHTLPNE